MYDHLKRSTCASILLSFSAFSCAFAADEAGNSETIDSTQQALAQEFTVMSLNARIPVDSGDRAWSARLPRLRDMILRYGSLGGPHLIGVQELRANTRDDLNAWLDAATGNNYGWHSVDRGDGEMIAIFYRRDRLTVLEHNFRNVSNGERDDACSLTDDEDPVNRPIQFVKVKDLTDNKQLYFYNTHYPSKNSCERRGMSTIFANWVASRADTSLPVVLVGDFNDGVEQDGHFNGSFADIVARTSTAIAYENDHVLSSASSFFTANGNWSKTQRKGKMIDHILVGDGIDTVRSDIDRTLFTTGGQAVNCPVVTAAGLCSNGMTANSLQLYSDHWAIWARLRML